jgi:RNA polymerase sigma-70 factor (ECF subfamily)
MAIDPTENFVRLLTRYEADVHRYIVSLLPGSAETDDVMQDTAALLWRKFSEYDPDRPFLPWAMRFAYFEVLKHRKKVGQSRLIFSDALVDTLAADYDKIAPELESRRKALAHCLTKLSGRDRELLQHRYDAGKTIQQLAAQQKRSVHKLYHTLDHLRGALMECVLRNMRKEGFDGI